MTAIKNHILFTKELNKQQLEKLNSVNLEITHHNFIGIEIQLPENLSQINWNENIVLTSKNAVKAWKQILQQLSLNKNNYSIFCLDEGTLHLAKSLDFRVEGSAQDASALAELIIQKKNIKSISFICGNLRRDELPQKLKSNNIDVQEVVAYKTQLTPIKIDNHIDAIVFFSPSGVDSYLQKNELTSATVFCIGKTTADHALKNGFVEVRIAERATPESLIEEIINYYNNQTIHA